MLVTDDSEIVDVVTVEVSFVDWNVEDVLECVDDDVLLVIELDTTFVILLVCLVVVAVVTDVKDSIVFVFDKLVEVTLFVSSVDLDVKLSFVEIEWNVVKLVVASVLDGVDNSVFNGPDIVALLAVVWSAVEDFSVVI